MDLVHKATSSMGLSMTIAEQILNGMTAEDLGMPIYEWESRKNLLDKFLLSWDGEEFETSYLAWIAKQEDTTLPRKESVPPNISKQVKTVSAAAIQFARSGFKRVTQEEHDARLEQCAGCTEFKKGRCMRCGCYMTLKAWLPQQHCLLGKW